MSKQTVYNAGIYVRLSQEDMRAGESLSVENQKLILTKYVAEQGWNLVKIYVDDGASGTDFNRPGVTELLDDAKAGKINLIIVKDLSRFGRNYIEVGRYIDYIFPAYNIRFIALNDNLDTLDKNSAAMDMMPIVNLFNEWHSASTSKKIKAVKEAKAKAGKYGTTFAAYGYSKGEDENCTPVVDETAAEIVRRIYAERIKGISPRHIADMLNEEKIPIPSDHQYAKIGKPNPRKTTHLWSGDTVKQILRNPIYTGNLYLQKTTTVSHKNHKCVKRDKEDWVVIPNNHEPIITQEIWDKVKEIEASVSTGKHDKTGFTAPLSGLMFCESCGEKMRICTNNTTNGSKKLPRKYIRHNYQCGAYNRYGKNYCTSHYIKMKDIDAIVLADIRSMAQLIVEDEEAVRKDFLEKKAKQNARQTANEKKRLSEGKYRLAELEKLIPSVYEDKVLGKIPENVCVELINKYQTEQRELKTEIAELETRQNAVKQDEADVEEFIRRLKKYVDVQELTREMCLELIEYITVDEYSADRPREIHIYYKLLEKPLKDKHRLDTAKMAETA